MASTLVFGEQITVTAALGFIVREFTLDSSQLNGDDVLDGTLEGIDISPYVQSLTINRGRSDQFSSFRTGTTTIVLNNNDRRFDPINQASPYWDSSTGKSGVTPRRRVEIKSGDTAIFTGRITDIDVEYNYQLSTCTITASDDFVLLANAFTGAAFTPSAELSGARVSAILDLPEVDYPTTTRAIDTGVATVGAYEIAANTNAAAYLQRVAEAEQGLFYVSGDGTLTFTDRVTSVFSSPIATFTDSGSGGINYQALDTIYGQEFLFNRVQTQTETGSVQEADDSGSQTEFGISTLALTNLLLSSDAAALTLANKLLSIYKNPAYRFDNLRVLASAQTSGDRDTIMSLDMGDVITVTRTFASGTPASVSDDYAIERITHQITPDRHTVTIGMYVADIVFPFTLNDATYGVLDATNAVT
jgi:hypothetical protein